MKTRAGTLLLLACVTGIAALIRSTTTFADSKDAKDAALPTVTVTSVTPAVGANDRTQRVSLRGKGFGSDTKAVSVLLGTFTDAGVQQTCDGVHVTNDELLDCALPLGLARGAIHFTVVVRGAKTLASDPSSATYTAVATVHPVMATPPVKELAACAIHLRGTDVTVDGGAPRVVFNGTRSCDDVWTIGSTDIICHMAIEPTEGCESFSDASKFHVLRVGE